MISSGEAILADIDSTLDQLICNADAMNRITDRHLFTSEVKAMHKTQEPSCRTIMHELFDEDKKVIGEREQKMRLTVVRHKLAEFGKLNARMSRIWETGMKPTRRSKSEAESQESSGQKWPDTIIRNNTICRK